MFLLLTDKEPETQGHSLLETEMKQIIAYENFIQFTTSHGSPLPPPTSRQASVSFTPSLLQYFRAT